MRYPRAVQQVIGREGETATFFSRCLFNSALRVAVSPHVNYAVTRIRFASKEIYSLLLFLNCFGPYHSQNPVIVKSSKALAIKLV